MCWTMGKAFVAHVWEFGFPAPTLKVGHDGTLLKLQHWGLVETRGWPLLTGQPI